MSIQHGYLLGCIFICPNSVNTYTSLIVVGLFLTESRRVCQYRCINQSIIEQSIQFCKKSKLLTAYPPPVIDITRAFESIAWECSNTIGRENPVNDKESGDETSEVNRCGALIAG